MHISVSDPDAPSNYEWTMSRKEIYLINTSHLTYDAYRIDEDGGAKPHGLSGSYSARPVFFLKSDIQFIGGTGKSDDPFIIS